MNERAAALAVLNAEIVACRLCARLVAWREEVARTKRAAYADQTYWGRPVPSFGDPDAWLVVVGLAPGAHGSNRTGRPFTGDGSGEILYRTLHRAGLASRPDARSRDDDLRLHGTLITGAVRCAPPANRPQADEWAACRPFLARELALLSGAQVVVALGGFAYSRVMGTLRDLGRPVPRPMPRFGHGLEVPVGDLLVIGCYHPSQQNTFTGRLTETMLDDVWRRALEQRLSPQRTQRAQRKRQRQEDGS